MEERRTDIRLAVCIPTYKRARVVQDFLERAAETYIDAGIDIYYYDSSPDDETEKTIRPWMEAFSGRIFYIRMPEELHANMKVYRIFQLYGMEKDYEFIWVCNDAIRFSVAALEQITGRLDRKYDIIEADARDVQQLGTREYDNYNEYLRDCAWELTLFGAAILNTATVLRDVDWDRYEREYSRADLINFSHVGFYFTRICEFPSFRALHISIDPQGFSSSLFKKEPGWYSKTGFIFCEAWVRTIEHLPELYTTKAEAIKNHGRYSSLEDGKAFCRLRANNAFSLRLLRQYWDEWPRVCDVPMWKLCLIALTPKIVLERKPRKLKKKGRVRGDTALYNFCRAHGEIYLFGAGRASYSYDTYLHGVGIEYQGLCVTNPKENPASFCGHPVCGIDELENKRDSVGIVVALGRRKGPAVQEMLKQRGFCHVFFDGEFFGEIAGNINGEIK